MSTLSSIILCSFEYSNFTLPVHIFKLTILKHKCLLIKAHEIRKKGNKAYLNEICIEVHFKIIYSQKTLRLGNFNSVFHYLKSSSDCEPNLSHYTPTLNDGVRVLTDRDRQINC